MGEIKYDKETGLVVLEEGKPPLPLNLVLIEQERRRLVAENEELIEKQLALWRGKKGRKPTPAQREEFKRLVQYDRKSPPRELDKYLDIVATGMKTEGIPAQYWTIILSKTTGRVRVAPDSHGRFRKAQLDPKIMIGTPEITITHRPTETEPFVEVLAKLRFYAGDSEYVGYQVKWIPWTADEGKKQDICNICITQALGKAARNACPTMFPDIAEEVFEFEEGEIAGPPTITVGEIRSITDLLASVYRTGLKDPDTGEELFHKRDKLAALAGVERLELLNQPGQPTFQEAWEKILNACGQKSQET